MKNLLSLIALIFLFGAGIHAQTTTVPTAPVDTVNLAKRLSLSSDDFKFEINNYTNLMLRKITFRSYNDYIVLVRLFNTIEESAQYQKQPWVPLNKVMVKNFYTLFRWQYMDRTITQLAFQKRDTGVGYYSPYFKIGIGLTEPPKDTDFYQITR
jgi:hypothetical protein